MAKDLRRSDRLLIRIPVEVSMTDLEGNSITERTHTLAIDRNGASFALRNSFRKKDQITVKNLHTSQLCRFRACEAIQDLPDGFREWGMECVDPAPNFWNISFPGMPEKPSVEEQSAGCLLECTVCHYREMTRVTLSEYRMTVEKTSSARDCIWCGKQTEWKFAIIEEDVEATSTPGVKERDAAVSLASRVEIRREERRTVQLPIWIRHQDGREELTRTENVSRSGVCCAASMEVEVGDRVLVRLVSDEGPGEAEFLAQIMWCRKLNEKRGTLYGMKLGRKKPPAA
jgi:hypothetical protein